MAVVEEYLSYSIQMYSIAQKRNEQGQRLQRNRLSFREMFAVVKKDMQIDLNDTAATKVLSFKEIDGISCLVLFTLTSPGIYGVKFYTTW